MAKYKITKTDEYYTYELPAHNECKLTRLHDPADVEGGKLILSRSHFLPAGGGTDFRGLPDLPPLPTELIFRRGVHARASGASIRRIAAGRIHSARGLPDTGGPAKAGFCGARVAAALILEGYLTFRRSQQN